MDPVEDQTASTTALPESVEGGSKPSSTGSTRKLPQQGTPRVLGSSTTISGKEGSLPRTSASVTRFKEPSLDGRKKSVKGSLADSKSLLALASPAKSKPEDGEILTEEPREENGNGFLPIDQIPQPLTEGLESIFLTSQTQELFGIKGGVDVSREKPYRMIPKPDILADMATRMAISDFTPFKQKILDYPQDEIVLCFDADFKFGQNFLIALTVPALESIVKPLLKALEITEPVKPAVKREWTSRGSEAEIEMASVIPTRNLIHVKISRRRREFGAPCKFGDRDAAHEALTECRPYRDANYELSRMELDVGVQAVPYVQAASSQTTWNRSVNSAIQYEPILYDQKERTRIMELEEMREFLQNVTIRFEQALQQNEIVDLFRDDYKLLGDEDVAVGQGAHTVLQEFQSFTDLRHSKDKSISCVDWHPNIKGVVAISCTQRMTYDERVETGHNVESRQSLILIWSFNDPIHPQVILEAPDDISCFQFNPGNPNLIAGGCINGEVVVWDITEFHDKLKSNTRKTTKPSSPDGLSLHSGTRDNKVETPFLRYVAVSSIEASHKASITDLVWLSKTAEINQTGEILDSHEDDFHQLATTSLDGQVYFWDTHYKKDIKALDLVWKPFLKVPLSAIDNTFDYGCTKISIRMNVEGAKDGLDIPMGSMEKQAANHQYTKFYCATEEGDLIYADWVADKSEEKASRVEHALSSPFGPMMDLDRSPFFPDIILSVGGWAFHIWKEKVITGPLLSSVQTTTYLTGGCWSPTRPGVLYIARADGAIEVWDLLDRSHVPSAVQNISSTGISNIAIRHYQAKARKYQQFLAAGDDEGTLHILEVPRNLTKPAKNERVFVKAFFDREVRRIEYSQERRRMGERARSEVPVPIESAPKKEEANNVSTGGSSERVGGVGTSAQEQAELDAGLLMEKEYLALESRLLEAFA